MGQTEQEIKMCETKQGREKIKKWNIN